MNASLLAITNMLADSTRIGRTSSPALRPEVTSDTKPFSLNLTDNLKRPTTDNNITNNTKSDPMSPSKVGSPDFSGTFLRQAQDGEQSRTICKEAALQTPRRVAQPQPLAGTVAFIGCAARGGAKPCPLVTAERAGAGQVAGLKRLNPAENPAPHETRTDTDLTQTATDPPLADVRPCIGAGASAQGTPTTTGGSVKRSLPPIQSGVAIPKDFAFEAATRHLASQQPKEGETAANSAQLINNPCLNKLTPFLRSNAGGLNAADKQQHVGCAPHTKKEMVGTRLGAGSPSRSGTAHPTDKASVLSEKVVVAKDLIGPKGGQEPMAKVVAIGSQKTTTAERPGQTDTTAGSAGQKTAILNYSFPPVQRKSSDPPHRPSSTVSHPTRHEAQVTDTDELRRSCQSVFLDSNKAKSSDNPGLDVTKLQISTGQSKDGGNSPLPTFAGTSLPLRKQGADRFFTAAGVESTTGVASSIEFERSFILTQNANIAKNALHKDISKDISEQIIESIHSSLRQADKQITIRLNPPELGQVFLRFQEREAEITGLLEVSKAEIRYEIEQALPQIIRTLADSGVQIKRLEVQLTDQLESAPGGLGADSFEQGGSGNPPWVRQRWSDAVTDTYSYEDIGEPVQRRAEGPLWPVTNGGINVLI